MVAYRCRFPWHGRRRDDLSERDADAHGDVDLQPSARAGAPANRYHGWADPENFNGSIDDVRIYERALSANEIRSLATEIPR